MIETKNGVDRLKALIKKIGLEKEVIWFPEGILELDRAVLKAYFMLKPELAEKISNAFLFSFFTLIKNKENFNSALSK